MFDEPQPPQGENLPQPAASQPAAKRRGIGAALAGLGVLLLKFKALLFAGKFFASTWTFFLALWLYVVAFGWPFAIVLILAIAAHELGHYAAFRGYGLKARLPIFLPFVGAFTSGEVPADLEHDAYIALAGPLTGLGIAGACYGLGIATGERFWYTAADVSAFLNLFNMIPSPPFDGGRIVGAIWPPMWFAGFIIFVVIAALIHVPLLFVILIGAIGVPSMLAAWRGSPDPRAAAMTNAARLRVSVWYLATLLGLIVLLGDAHRFASGASGTIW